MVAVAVIGSSIIGAGASLLAGGAQARSADRAATLAAQATDTSTEELRRQYNLTREDFAPYRETGTTALALYGGLYGVGREGMLSPEEMEDARGRFMETPGYEFRYDEITF